MVTVNMGTNATNQLITATPMGPYIARSTADLGNAVLPREEPEAAPGEQVPSTSATLVAVAGELFVLEKDAIPPGTPIPPDSAIAREADEPPSA
ncbi:MAG: hypothetical protein ACLQT7_07600 [Candidatus Dormibacteria bacterium]